MQAQSRMLLRHRVKSSTFSFRITPRLLDDEIVSQSSPARYPYASRAMKLHEYQSKKLLSDYGVPVPGGEVADNRDDARRIAELYGGKVVVKAQVLMGGRGKAG